MTGRWRNAKALRAGNVVCLPTAAPRQVQQPCNKAGREARVALRKAHPWPGEYIFPTRREALRTAATIVKIEASPALTIVLSLVSLLGDEIRLQLVGRIAACGSPAAADAVALINSQKLTFGDRVDLEWALKQLHDDGAAKT